MPDDSLAGLGKGMVFTGGGLLAGGVGSIAVTSLGVHSLGPAAYGRFALAVSVVALLGAVDFGLGLVVVRAVADAGTRAGRVRVAHSVFLFAGLAVALVGAALGVALGGSLAVAGVPAGRLRVLFVMVALAGGIGLATSALPGVAMGAKRVDVVVVANTLGAAVTVATAVALLHPFGVAALGVAEAAGAVAAAAVSAVWVHRAARWFSFRPRRPSREEVHSVLTFTTPLLVLGISSQLLSFSDLVIVAVIGTARDVGLYRVGALLPTIVSGAFFAVYDTSFPWLAASPATRRRDTARLAQLAAYTAAAGFTALSWCATDVVVLFTGHHSGLAAGVFIVFCATWATNSVVHGLAILLIAEDRHHLLGRLVAWETVANVAVSVGLAVVIGPIGVAVGTLATIVASNLVVFPLLTRRVAPGAAFDMFRRAMPAALAGVAVACAVAVPLGVASKGLVHLVVLPLGTAAVSIVLLVVVAGGWGGLRYLVLERPGHRL